MSPTLRNKKSLDPGGKNKPEEIAARDNDVDREDQNADQEYLDIGVDEDLFAGEKEETSSNRNNNNAKTSTKNQPAKNQPTKKKDTVPVPETDRRRTYFFLTPGTKKANIAAEENHARQLNVHGLPSEFLECQAGGVQDNALYQLFMKLGKDKIGRHGIDIEPHHIVGACPVKQTANLKLRRGANNESHSGLIRDETTNHRCRHVRQLLGHKHNTTFLRDVPPVKKSPSENSEEDHRKRTRTCPKNQKPR